uniref:Calcineurin-like phosphoesterase domain-containing protein n=1 Tax=Oryza nivara TaxID=4536 RepID=A0A0E0HLU2_ORYNI
MEVEAARRSKRPPWSRTVAVQVALCVAMYAAFSLGEPRLHRNRGRGGGGGVEASLGRGGRGGVSFLSVAGGARPAAEQARLLRQMESIAKAYKVKFVVDVAQLGEEDPLWQNIIGNFLKRVMMPYDQSLEIIGMDTGSLQEPIHDGKIRASSREQFKWLEQSIAATSSNWKIVVGYDPFFVCAEAHTLETTKLYEPLQRIFAKYGVNAYISTGGHCGYFRQDNSMLYIGNPSPDDLTSSDGFLLHIVNLLEMESLLINLEGKVVERFVVNHHRLEAL